MEINRKKVTTKFNELIKNKRISKNIEKSIFNHTTNICKKRNKTADYDRYFLRRYLNKCVSLYDNINPESYIGNKKLLKKNKKKKHLTYLNLQQCHHNNYFQNIGIN